MNKICTSIEQSKELIELGIDVNTADMYWWHNGQRYYVETKEHNDFQKSDIPTWSLSALLELMPKIHEERPKLDTGRIQTEKYYVEYPYHESTKYDWYSTKLCNSAVDAAFEMVVWLKKNKKL